MLGVGLVGFSGSMIKNAVSDSGLQALVSRFAFSDDSPAPEPTAPEATSVLLGEITILLVG
jgi:hypothetical protein